MNSGGRVASAHVVCAGPGASSSGSKPARAPACGGGVVVATGTAVPGIRHWEGISTPKKALR
eukprot:9512655-Lingulodinium_polyedra.AAC.1